MSSFARLLPLSDALQDRHPYNGEPFPKGCVKGEIAEAYGARRVVKLVDVLALPEDELPSAERVRCLHMFTPLLSNQEHKTEAVIVGALPALVRLVAGSSEPQVRTLSCHALTSLARLATGRAAIAGAGGVAALTAGLASPCADAAVQTLQAMTASPDGNAHLLSSRTETTCALVALLSSPATALPTAAAAVSTLAGMVGSGKQGVLDALSCQAPEAVVALASRMLNQQLAAGIPELGVVDACARCLQQVCLPTPAARRHVREAGGIEVLASMLVVPHTPIVQHAAAALSALSVDPPAKLAVMLHAGEALAGLLKGVAAEQAVTRTNARSALLASLEHLEARRRLEQLLSPEERATLLGPLPIVPPDYHYVVRIPPPEEAATADDEPVA